MIYVFLTIVVILQLLQLLLSKVIVIKLIKLLSNKSELKTFLNKLEEKK